MTDDADTLANAYFECWRAKDFDRLRTMMADDITFVGPLAEVAGADAYRDSLAQLGAITTDIVVERRWVDGDDVLTWFVLHTSVAEPTPVASWIHVEDGRLQRVRVTFDPRGMLGG